MTRKTHTIQILCLHPFADLDTLQVCSLDDDPICIAEAVADSLPPEQHLISISVPGKVWHFETRLRTAWRTMPPGHR